MNSHPTPPKINRKTFAALVIAATFFGFGFLTTSGQTLHPTESMQLPPGFDMVEVAGGLRAPMDMAFLPNDDILVLEKGSGLDEDSTAYVKLVRNGVVQPTPVLTLSVNAETNAGLTSLVLDPFFERNYHFYLWYSTGKDARNWTGESVNRLSRFTYDMEAGTAALGSEVVILDQVPWSVWHNGGGLLFDDKGLIYVTTGDNTVSENGQDLTSLNGKVLRILPTDTGYSVPPDNPFLDEEEARPEIYGFGLRNPFRATHRLTDGKLFVADVGEDTWEEVNEITAGANYGWSDREGFCPRRKRQPCRPAPARYTDPIVAYEHPLADDQGGGLTALAFYEGTAFPEEFQGKLFFHDYDQQYLAAVDVDDPQAGITRFAAEIGHLSDMEYHHDSLYLVELWHGKIYRLYYTGASNQAPTAKLTVDKNGGPAPLTVTLSAEGSQDPDDPVITYVWDFGDGSELRETTEPTTSHTYMVDGTYTARLEVADIRGGRSTPVEQTITVYSGEWPEIRLENLVEPDRSLFHGGDTIRAHAVRDIGNLNLDLAAPFSWDVGFHHNKHVHPVASGIISDTLSLAITRENHDGDWNVWFRFSLTMQTASGQRVTVEKELHPALADVRVETFPEGLPLKVDNVANSTPHAFRAVVGTDYHLEAGETVLYADGIGAFDFWRTYPDWSADAVISSSQEDENILYYRVPIEDSVIIAHYRYKEAARQNFLPLVVR